MKFQTFTIESVHGLKDTYVIGPNGQVGNAALENHEQPSFGRGQTSLGSETQNSDQAKASRKS